MFFFFNLNINIVRKLKKHKLQKKIINLTFLGNFVENEKIDNSKIIGKPVFKEELL